MNRAEHHNSPPADAPLILPADTIPAIDSPDEALSALRAILEGTAERVGEAFLQSLVQHLAKAVGSKYAFVTEFLPNGHVRTLAYWKGDHIAANVEWDLTGTPCQDVIAGNLCHHPSGVSKRFPRDIGLVNLQTESFLGVPLLDKDGSTMGHLAVFDPQPMPAQPRRLYIFRIFAARAAAELQRLRMDKQLADSERRYRDLYEEAPIAYIYEDLDSRFVRANHSAQLLLGIKPEEVTSTYGLDLLAPTAEMKQRVMNALEAMKRDGTTYASVELELRRKDNGKPLWVQWWSRPEPDGKHTRTMLVDITQRVLMEREKARLEQQNLYLQEEIKQAHNFEEIVGRSPALLSVLANVARVAPTDSSVLICGETGTGKELIARAIHNASTRKDKPLIKVNCAALPSGLVESELFGHERGAFSGAIARRLGRFELANGGTIFLDEIGELPLEVQAKLLRVLQEREFERVGGGQPIRIDVRVIAATNRDLDKAVREGTFRQDLFYRLNVFPLQLPPLRQRKADIPLLVHFLLNRYRTRFGKRIDGVTRATMQRLTDYRWPGNIRELENLLERAAILAAEPILEIEPEQTAPPAAPDIAANEPTSQSMEAMERAHLLSVLQRTNWVIDGDRGAAKVLELHPNTLRSRLKKLGIAKPLSGTTS
jgi:PAS domain S-box-containing protein